MLQHATALAVSATTVPVIASPSLPPSQTPTQKVPLISHQPSGTIILEVGETHSVSNPDYSWSLQIPKSWIVLEDTGFEFSADEPTHIAHAHLLSQTWLTKERKPTARAYVDYWKQSKFGNLFPLLAQGEQVSEQEVSQDKFGGPYLRYVFDDGVAHVHYIQVYASSATSSSLVLTVWAKNSEFDSVKGMLEDILNSAALQPQK